MSRVPLLIAVVLCCANPTKGDDTTSQQAPLPQIVAAAFPIQGPATGLEPEVLDFRYRPERGQVCIGLPDDPYKTIVGSDGGLYYDYNKRGPQPYANGQGIFGTRLLASIRSTRKPGPIDQQLVDARTPIVITRQQFGTWQLQQRAWASTRKEKSVDQWKADRVDYLWITARNRSGKKEVGHLALDVGSIGPLQLDATRTRLYRLTPNRDILCRLSTSCLPLGQGPALASANTAGAIASPSNISVSRNWAHPKSACTDCFKHVLVGFGEPLIFKFKAKPKQAYRAYVGLIEGWHNTAGQRPLELRVEGRKVQTFDLVRQVGQNVPTVSAVTVQDQDGDGLINIGVWPAPGAVDKNTIISGLWIYPSSDAPSTQDVLHAKANNSPLAVVDADHVPPSNIAQTLQWDLAGITPGRSFELLVTVPQGNWAKATIQTGTAQEKFAQALEFWKHADLPYDRIIVPDPAIQQLLDSCIRNIYQAREVRNGRPVFQVGPTCYRGTWAADGPFILEAVTYLGRADQARTGLEGQVDGDTGPSGVAFSKKSGLRLWMILRHAQLTQDDIWLRKMWPRVVREVNQIIEYRQMTRSDPNQANFGLMPIGFGDGGLGGKHREYTNVYWTLAGLKAAIQIADRLGDPLQAKWQAEYQDYWKTFDAARQRDKLVDSHGNTYVPVTMKGEQPQLPQRGAWACLQSIFPGRVFENDDPLMTGTMAMLDANQREGLIFGTGWIPDGIWNYAGSFYAHAHLWLGHGRKAAATLYAFGNHASPLLCWREEQRPIGDPPQFVGDMPHNWASAEFIRLVRHLLILERGSDLHLLEGLPRSWVRPGARLELKQIPTSFGPIDLRMQVAADGRKADLVLSPPKGKSLRQVVIHLESFSKGKRTAQWTKTAADAKASPVHLEIRLP